MDGFSTASAAFLILLVPNLTALDTALMTSLYLAGSFLGSLVVGPLADRFGRRRFFLSAPLGILLLTLGAIVLPEITVILAMRLLTGFLVGGDYPVAQAVVAERVSPEHRASALTAMMYAWNAGALAAVLAAVPILAADAAWRNFWIIQAVLAALFWLMRVRIPESAAWMAAKAMVEGAPKASVESDGSDGRSPVSAAPRAGAKNLRNFFFCAGFWLCQTIPVTVMMFYAGRIIEALTGSTGPVTHMLLLYGFFLVGALPAMLPVVSSRPRAVLLATYVAMAAGLGLVGFGSGTLGSAAASFGFVIFAFAYGLQAPIDFVYPNQLFPTEVRARWVGLVTAAARVGATLSAFAFPWLLELFGAPALFAGGMAVLALGFLLGCLMAPPDVSFQR